MGSKYDDDQTKMRNSNPAVAAGYPPPPVPGYPPPQVAFPGYPNAPSGYPRHSAPPQAGYYNNVYQGAPESSDAYKVVRRLIIGMISTFVIIGMLFFFVWLMIRPRYPVAKIDSLVVSNFTIVDSKLNASWDINFNIWNPNSKLDLQFKNIDILIFYRRNLLSTSSMQPALLEKMHTIPLHDKLVTVQKIVEEDLESDQKSESVIVSVRFRIWTMFRNEEAVSRDYKIAVVCEGLRLIFEGGTGNGEVGPGPGHWNCMLYEV